jgi:glycosyltransferase involved in cell wall biosynthesis
VIRFVAALACAVTALTVPAQARAFAPIPITVRAEDDVARHRWPLTVSVPFARGLLQRGQAVKVVDEHGGAAPVQARPLVTWPDGSVRWLLLDTQVDVKPRHAHRLRVEPGAAPAPAATVRATEGEDGVTIDTGAMHFLVPKKRFAIVDAVQLRGEAKPLTGPLGAVLVAGERTGQAQPPTRIVVSEKGPLRARVDLQGTYDNHFDYLVRIEAYAGHSVVRVWHTFINRFPSPNVSVPRIGLELPLAEPFPKYRYDSEGAKPIAGNLRDEGLRLFQPDNIAYQVNGVASAGHLSGWIELEGLRGTVGLSSRWFWQEYPQSITARADKLVYNLWAPEADPANAGVGVAKTHEFALWFAKPQASTPGIGAALAAPLLGVVDAAHIAHSAALPAALAPQGASARFVNNALIAARRYAARNEIEVWNDCGAVHCDTAERPRTGAYGMWNWGDWNFRGYKDTTKGTDSWGNQEYDTSAVLAWTYAASGAPDVHDMMVAAARHFIDRFFPGEYRVIPNGVDPQRVRPARDRADVAPRSTAAACWSAIP